MPGGKPAGVRCIQLDEDDGCKIFGHPDRPLVCASLQPSEMMCGNSREQAMRWLGWLEKATSGEQDKSESTSMPPEVPQHRQL